MNTEQNNNKRQGGQTAGSKWLYAAIIIAVIIVGILIKPRYVQMVTEDRLQTCHDARWILSMYYHEVWDSSVLETELPPEPEYAARAMRIAEAAFDGNCDADRMEVHDVCRAGGTWKIFIDEETGALKITCDAPGHEDYLDLFEEYHEP